MREFKLQRARAGVWVRYLNVPLLVWFASDTPMPADKQLLMVSCLISLVANVIFHIHLELTRRHRVSSYLMLASEQFTIGLSLYATGVTMSPFLLIYPLLPFSAFFVDFEKRAAVWFGIVGIVELGFVYAVWWSQGAPVVAWVPRDYPVWVWSICVIQMLALCAYIFLASEADPLVLELARSEQALLRQAHRAELGTALSQVAHELRNPIHTIGFSLELAGQAARLPGTDPRIPKQIRNAEAELDRMTRMVHDLLAFARERRGRMHPADHPPAALVERAVDFLRMKWGRHHQKFRVEADLADAPAVRCDADAMHQVLVNQIENSIQHAAPDRPLRVEIRHARRDGRIALVLRDNGTGIPVDRLARLFEGFDSDRAEGTGLGMRISRQLMEDQGGAIEVTSTAGAGTTVILLLPPAGTAADAAGDPAPGIPAPSPGAVHTAADRAPDAPAG